MVVYLINGTVLTLAAFQWAVS